MNGSPRSRSTYLLTIPLAFLATMACAREGVPPESTGSTEHAETPSGVPGAAEGASEAQTGERSFGAPLVGNGETVPLGALLDEPARYTGQVVRTEGEISAVCQRMGCWMELRDSQARAVRVPMAGHAFFLPRDVAGRRAIVEGPLTVRPLGAAEREHLASEGAGATDVALELSATSVVILAPAPG
ncbi:MAG: DUF4920 domain-containing protein [Sandaracinaceae bacterium]|nr:DUF4920 domain-containing protein [Myxococcales bacterium]MCB9662164.1 DUF4920 domain-containing protein [Sandaracinaceae bacterium]